MSLGKSDIPKSEIENKLIKCLESQGFKLTKEAKVKGKSGIEHKFDFLAQADDGLISSNVVICLATPDNKEPVSDIIFNFANKAYDIGAHERVIVAVPEFNSVNIELAQKWRIKVFDLKQLSNLLDQNSKPHSLTKTNEPFKFNNKEEIVQSLIKRGYRVEENAKITGRSRVAYTFDILAYTGANCFGHSLGIDFLSSNSEINLDQVSLFDTKAYDTGIDSKILVVKPKLSPEARQLAEQQRIKVFEKDKTEEEPLINGEAKKILESLVVKPKSGLKLHPTPEAIQLIPEVIARRYNAIPLSVSDNICEIAMLDPTDIFGLEALTAISRKRIKPIAADAKDVREAIDFNYKGYSEIEKQVAFIPSLNGQENEKIEIDMASYTPLVQAVNMIIEEAAKARASDIHFEPEENRLRVRYRIDGTLHDMMSLPLNIHRPLISRLKILSELNIADSHHPQDGQFSANAKGRQIDIRVATTPTVYGEMSVLRLLDKSLSVMELNELGFLPDSLAKFQNLLRVPYGMIMVIGPTGSGKTTTLYAAINTLDTQKSNVITIEDPAEYRLKDINQIQVNVQAGLTFATGLRAILRLDPNVIMVGEIRDGETADIAVQSAMTGHLMLTTLHANDTTGALNRLIDLGVEPFLAASSVIGVVSQRMVRRLCPDCQRTTEAPALEQTIYEKEMGEKRSKFPYGTGCKNCSYTGYRGRVGMFEILTLSDNLKMMVAERASSTSMRTQALKEGIVTMMNDGMQKVKAGITTPSEVLRAAYTTSL
jgi:general secretion pathway protein E